MTAEYQDVVPELVATFPALQPLMDEHLEDNFGELLPMLLIADVGRWIVAHLHDPQLVGPVLDWLEHEARDGSQDVRDFIAVGFVESLPRHDEPGGAVLSHLGPALTQLAEGMGLLRG